MRRCGSGGTGSVRCSPPRSGSGEFIADHTHSGAGTWTRCSCVSMARHIICGARLIMSVIGNAADQECGRWLNNRVENSHQPFRRREGAMSKVWDVKTLQKFASIHASIHNQFNLERHLTPRETFKQNRAAAMAEWRQLLLLRV